MHVSPTCRELSRDYRIVRYVLIPMSAIGLAITACSISDDSSAGGIDSDPRSVGESNPLSGNPPLEADPSPLESEIDSADVVDDETESDFDDEPSDVEEHDFSLEPESTPTHSTPPQNEPLPTSRADSSVQPAPKTTETSSRTPSAEPTREADYGHSPDPSPDKAPKATGQPTQEPTPEPDSAPTTRSTSDPSSSPTPTAPEPTPNNDRTQESDDGQERSPEENNSDVGLPEGGTLEKITEDIVVTEPGAVIDGVDLHGHITVQAPNVTIRNSIIRGDGSTGQGPPLVMSESTNLLIRDTEIASAVSSPNINGIMGSNFTLDRVNIHNVVDQVHIYGDGNVTIKDSWLHSNIHYENDPNWDGEPTHDDNVQIQSGSNITITGSRLEGSNSAAVMITQDQGPVSDVHIENNTFAGGSCSINIAEKGYGPLRSVRIQDNVFERDQAHLGCAIIRPESSPIGISENAWTDGSPVLPSLGE